MLLQAGNSTRIRASEPGRSDRSKVPVGRGGRLRAEPVPPFLDFPGALPRGAVDPEDRAHDRGLGAYARERPGGRSPDTPVAVIRWGTYPTQRTVVGTLAAIARETARADMQPPGLIVVGEVVRLRERLNWFERRPLFGRSVIVTRAEAQAGELVGLLRDAGAEVIEAPAIRLDYQR